MSKSIITTKYRLYPTEKQEILFRRHAGSQRFLWNAMIDLNNAKYKEEKKFIFKYGMNNLLPKLKKEYPWLKEVNSQTLQSSCSRLDESLKKFLKARKNPQLNVGFPSYQKRRNNLFFDVPQYTRVEDGRIYLPKIKYVKAVTHREDEPLIRDSKVKSCTVVFDGLHWYACVAREIQITNEPKSTISTAVGVDVGISTFAQLSDGSSFERKSSHSLTKLLKQSQRQLSRKQKGSNNYKKQLSKFNKLSKKKLNQLIDFQHKTSNSIAKNYDLITIENLDLRSIHQSKYGKLMSEQQFHRFFSMLEYKAKREGSHLVKVDRFFPSSKMCSCCGTTNQDLTISDREWLCSTCGTHLNRDLNASINILNQGLSIVRQELPDIKLVESLTDLCLGTKTCNIQ